MHWLFSFVRQPVNKNVLTKQTADQSTGETNGKFVMTVWYWWFGHLGFDQNKAISCKSQSIRQLSITCNTMLMLSRLHYQAQGWAGYLDAINMKILVRNANRTRQNSLLCPWRKTLPVLLMLVIAKVWTLGVWCFRYKWTFWGMLAGRRPAMHISCAKWCNGQVV